MVVYLCMLMCRSVLLIWLTQLKRFDVDNRWGYWTINTLSQLIKEQDISHIRNQLEGRPLLSTQVIHMCHILVLLPWLSSVVTLFSFKCVLLLFFISCANYISSLCVGFKQTYWDNTDPLTEGVTMTYMYI